MSHKQDYTCRKTTADCTQMYTKIPIEDCLQQHYQLIDKCFEIQNSDEYKEHGGYTVPTDDPAYHRRAVGVQINRTKSSNAGIMVGQQKGRWNWVYRSDLHKNATLPNGKLKAKGQYEFFVSCHLLKKWLRLLLNNVIISFGQDIVLKQRIGLPMGIAPAVFCANYYCFAYEFEFFKQLIDQRHHPLLQEFCFYSRYVDDILSLRNNVLEKYFYLKNTDINGIHGIFPDFLIINIESDSPDDCAIMDVLIYPERPGPGLLQTTIYDKKDHPPLDIVESVQYPHPSSFLPSSSMYNILTSQIHRHIRLCSTRKEFVRWTRRVILKLLAKGYNGHRLKKICENQLHKVRYRYGMKTVEGIQKQIWDQIII